MWKISKDVVVNLIIDIGNTFAKIAVFCNDEILEVVYDSNQTLEKLGEVFEKYSIDSGIVASVIPFSDDVKCSISSLPIDMLYLNADTPLPIVNLYETPETLGYDRIAAVVGANAVFPDKNLLVIDAGTCITYEFIDNNGRYHGGNISPGMEMRFKALNHFTGKLPKIAADGETPLLGKSTETAIRAGVIKGLEFEILGYISTLRDKYAELFVFLTGGDEFSFDERIKNIIFADRFLVLKGLNRILNYNNGRI